MILDAIQNMILDASQNSWMVMENANLFTIFLLFCCYNCLDCHEKSFSNLSYILVLPVEKKFYKFKDKSWEFVTFFKNVTYQCLRKISISIELSHVTHFTTQEFKSHVDPKPMSFRLLKTVKHIWGAIVWIHTVPIPPILFH